MPPTSHKTVRRPLHDAWKFREVTTERSSPAASLPWLPAQVPGHVHLDLIRAGVIQDPFYRLGERGAVWVDHTDWLYEATFHADDAPGENVLLHFSGLDTVAEVELNGTALGTTDNMFVPHEFPVGGVLKAGENTLRVTFRSALKTGWDRQQAWNDAGNDTLPGDWFSWNSRSFVRKAQYMYGWDWGPEPVSCGIWRPIELVTVPVARLLDWRYETEFTSDGTAVVRLEAFVERATGREDAPLTLTAQIPETFSRHEGTHPVEVAPASVEVPAGEGRVGVKLELRIPDAKRWTPVGRGEPEEWMFPTLYRLNLSLEADGEEADTKTGQIGLRTVELLREPDADGQGEGFKFRVNGEDLYIKGANWIPVSSFPSSRPFGTELHDSAQTTSGRGGQDRVKALLEAAVEAEMNMLRVWGGGLYESEHFYHLCDELGLLVWQDFPYACAYYPDRGKYADDARTEATAAVRRVRSHPSLAMWCGNNENHQMFHDGWGGHRPPRYLGEAIYHEVLPAVVNAEDPGRPYIPSSPIGGDNPNSEDFGDRHDWEVWHGVGDWVNYRTDNGRFSSEFGFASSCGMATWNACLAEMDKDPNSVAVRWHDKTRKGYETYQAMVQIHYPVPQTLEDLVYYTQINQADALKCGVEHWRRKKGRCWGTLIWQLNDCWPVQSWAMIDSEGEPKAAYYAAKRFYAPVLLSLVRNGESVEAHLTNDLLEPVAGRVTVSIQTFEGERLAEGSVHASVAANCTSKIAELPLGAAAGREREVFVHAEFASDEVALGAVEPDFLLLAEPKDLNRPDPGLKIDVRETDGDAFLVTVSAERYVPYVWLRLEGKPEWIGKIEWSDNFFHLAPGGAKELLLYTSGLLDHPDEARTRLTVRCG